MQVWTVLVDDRSGGRVARARAPLRVRGESCFVIIQGAENRSLPGVTDCCLVLQVMAEARQGGGLTGCRFALATAFVRY